MQASWHPGGPRTDVQPAAPPALPGAEDQTELERLRQTVKGLQDKVWALGGDVDEEEEEGELDNVTDRPVAHVLYRPDTWATWVDGEYRRALDLGAALRKDGPQKASDARDAHDHMIGVLEEALRPGVSQASLYQLICDHILFWKLRADKGVGEAKVFERKMFAESGVSGRYKKPLATALDAKTTSNANPNPNPHNSGSIGWVGYTHQFAPPPRGRPGSD